MPSPNLPPTKSSSLLPSRLRKDSSTSSSDQTVLPALSPNPQHPARPSASNLQDPTSEALEASESPPTHNPFHPLFTLLESTPSGTHHHPSVHYLFSDDDTDALTDSILRIEEQRTKWADYHAQLQAQAQAQAQHGARSRARARARTTTTAPREQSTSTATAAARSRSQSLRQAPTSTSTSTSAQGSSQTQGPRSRTTSRASLAPYDAEPSPPNSGPGTRAQTRTSSRSPSASPAPAPLPPLGPRERLLVVSLDAAGQNVVSAHSLTPDWAVLSARVEAAASLEGAAAGKEEGGGMMLRVEGMEAGGLGVGAEGRVEREVEEKVEELRRRVGEIRGVVGSGEWRVGDEGEEEGARGADG